MLHIISRLLAYGEFEVVNFGDDAILNKPIEEWPACDALLTWHSEGFPLRKAQGYVLLRKPFLVNDVFWQVGRLKMRCASFFLTGMQAASSSGTVAVSTHGCSSLEVEKARTEAHLFVQDRKRDGGTVHHTICEGTLIWVCLACFSAINHVKVHCPLC